MRRMILALAFALLPGLAATHPASAETVTYAVRTPPTSLDPQLSTLSTDLGYMWNIYSTLFDRDPVTLAATPGLASGARRLDEVTWQIDLRKGVVFQNGQPFTSADVVFSFARLPTVPNSDRLQFSYLKPIAKMEAVDDFTLKVTTSAPTSDLPERMNKFAIICRCVEGATTEDFNTRKAAVGTGPYRVVDWVRGDRMVLEANPTYFGGPPKYDRVVLRVMANDASRVAALRAGDVDAIDFVPPGDAKRIAADPKLKVHSAVSTRTIFFPINTLDETAPATTDTAGQPLKTNPFRDPRVRQALTIALDRDALVSRVMEGAAKPVFEGVTDSADIYAETPVIKPDGRKAKQLLAEAGFPNGFGFTLGCPNDRYVNDADICQAAAQMWARAGLSVKVEAIPTAIYFKRMLAREFPVYLLGWGRPGKADASFVTDVLSTRNAQLGLGTYNSGLSNPKIDDLTTRGLSASTEQDRNALLREAMKLAVDEVFYVPSHAQLYVMATKATVTAQPNAQEITPAVSFAPAR